MGAANEQRARLHERSQLVTSKFSDTERAEILATSRRLLEAKPEPEPEAFAMTFEHRNDRDRRELEERDKQWAREREERPDERQRNATAATHSRSRRRRAPTYGRDTSGNCCTHAGRSCRSDRESIRESAQPPESGL